MSIELPIEAVPPSYEEKTNQFMNKLSKRFFEMNHKLWSFERKQKVIEFNGSEYADNSDKMYIPLNNDFGLCPEYKWRFKNEDTEYLGVITKSKQDSTKVELKIYKKGNSYNLNKKDIVLSSSVSTYPKYKEKKFTIDVDWKAIKLKNGIPIIANISEYLGKYFFEEEAKMQEEVRKEVRKEEIRQEIIENESESDPDEILEQLREEDL